MIEPTWRKPAGMFFILLLITVWLVLVATLTDRVVSLAWPLQVLIFGFFGLAWIIPLKPLLKWMETGKWR